MNLLMLALIKKAVDEQNRSYRRSSRKSKKGSKSPSSSSSSYSSKTYTQGEYLNKVVAEDPLLTAFFQAIEKKGDEIDDLDAEVIRKDVEEKLKAQAERVTKIKKIKDELAEAGIEFSDTTTCYGVTVGVKVTESYKSAFGNKGEYAQDTVYFPTTLDGLELKKEWFAPENREKNPFEDEYNNWTEKYKNLDEKIAFLEKEIKKYERKVKHAIFGVEKKEYTLENLKSELKSAEYYKREGIKLKRNKEIFDRLTPENKEKIYEYFEVVDECKEEGKDLSEKVKKYEAIKGSRYSYYSTGKRASAKERNKWQRTIDVLIANGELSEELLDAVDTIISEEDFGYEKYSDGLSEYDMSNKGFSENFRSAIAWYAETRKERIGLKALHRKEAAYKALEVEHKKLCDAAGLVDKAEELEEKDSNNKGDEEIDGE